MTKPDPWKLPNGETVAQAMANCKWTATDLSAAVGCSLSSACNYIRGTKPQRLSRDAVAKALNALRPGK